MCIKITYENPFRYGCGKGRKVKGVEFKCRWEWMEWCRMGLKRVFGEKAVVQAGGASPVVKGLVRELRSSGFDPRTEPCRRIALPGL